MRELAKAEKINQTYLCRVLRLSLLSPALTEAILNGQQPQGLDLKQLLRSLPIEWDKRGSILGQPHHALDPTSDLSIERL